MGRYSETLMDHFGSPRNSGVLESPDLIGQAGVPGRGPYLILTLRVVDDRIAEARFQTFGCGPTIASGSMLTELIIGRSIQDCRSLTAGDLIAALDGIPPEKIHCPSLAINALQDALEFGKLRTK